jgi:hypothetical protein
LCRTGGAVHCIAEKYNAVQWISFLDVCCRKEHHSTVVFVECIERNVVIAPGAKTTLSFLPQGQKRHFARYIQQNINELLYNTILQMCMQQ